MRIDPPVEIDIQIFNAGAEPHVGYAAEWEPGVITQRVGGDAFLSEGGKARIHIRHDIPGAVADVVIVGQIGGLSILSRRIESAAGQFREIEGAARDRPIDLISGNEVEAPGFDPSLPSGVGFLAGIVGVTGREGLKSVKDSPVAGGPGGKGCESQQGAHERHAKELFGLDARAWQTEHHGRREGHGGQCAIRPQQGGEGDREGEAEGISPAGPVVEAGHGPERQRQQEESGGFSERSGRIGGCERTERGEPEGCQRGAGTEGRRGNAANELSEEQASGKFERDLHATGGEVVLHAKEPEAGEEKERVAGQPDQGGREIAAGCVQGVAAMEQQGFGEAAVDEGISIHLKEVFEHAEAEGQAGGKGQRGRRQASDHGRLTLRGGFHTIRTV